MHSRQRAASTALPGPGLGEVVGEFHEAGDGGVELEAVQVRIDFLYGLVKLPAGVVGAAAVDGVGEVCGVTLEQVPDAVRPAGYAVDARVGPVATLVPGAEEHEIGANDVGAKGFDVLVGADDVAAGLAHLGAAGDDGALVKEAEEGLVEVEQTHVPHALGEEAGVEQVHDGVFCAAGVLVDGEPAVQEVGVEGRALFGGAGEAEHVPGGIDEGVHSVGLSLGETAAAGAGGVDEILVDGQGGLAGGLELGVQRKKDGQLVVRNGDGAAICAVDEGDGGAPVALAGDEPVADAVGDGAATPVVGLHEVGDGLGSLGAGHAVEGGGIDHHARFGEGAVGVRFLAFGRADDGADGETVLLGELVVALVVGGDAHDDAGAVGGEDVVGDVEGYSLAVEEG